MGGSKGIKKSYPSLGRLMVDIQIWILLGGGTALLAVWPPIEKKNTFLAALRARVVEQQASADSQ